MYFVAYVEARDVWALPGVPIAMWHFLILTLSSLTGRPPMKV